MKCFGNLLDAQHFVLVSLNYLRHISLHSSSAPFRFQGANLSLVRETIRRRRVVKSRSVPSLRETWLGK
jgi:hypothetical protein